MPSVQGANEGDRAARIFVWSVWVGLAWWLLHYVNAHAVNMPYYDEWELVPALTGTQPITLEWLWSQHNEHRIFLPRLIYVVLAKFTGCDVRAGMYFNAVVLLACSAALIALVQRRRGNAEATDVVFALLFLNLGQAQTLTNSFQIAFSVIPAVAVPILLLYWQPGRATFRATLTAACCTLLLPLIGGTGIALVPALVAATLLGCWQLFRDGKAWFQVVAPSLIAILATLLTLFYFSNYSRPAKHPASPSIGATLDGTAQFLSVGFGGAAQSLWPASKWGVLVICLTSLAVVGYLVVKRPEQRDQALRLLLFAFAELDLIEL